MTIDIKHAFGIGPIQVDAMTIRTTVFVNEQGVAINEELDGHDAEAIHIIAYFDGKLAATARLLEEDIGVWHVQRVATVYSMRGKGLGSALFDYIEKLAPGYQIHTLILGAQLQARGFYDGLDFESFGDQFLDAGIWHVNMKKKLTK
ncbi:GNAT family N-acetyltransferase [Lipomyces japonicus]|uniref:GNAT family N-acetyltransferase n=1 Tax=Lipomyces japonicus TaxID=56871 RepID=UPI0034CD253C